MAATFPTIELGSRIRDARVGASLTQAELADALALSRNYVAQVEMGRKKPSIKTLDAIANATHTSTIDLLQGDDFIEKITKIASKNEAGRLKKEIDKLILSLSN